MPVENKESFSYEVVRESDEVILIVECEHYLRIPSIEDDAETMRQTCNILIEVPSATKIIFKQKRDYEYEFDQVSLLVDIAKIANKLMKDKVILSYNNLTSGSCTKCVGQWYSELSNLASNTLKSDPIGAYVWLRRRIREEKIRNDKEKDNQCIKCREKLVNILENIVSLLEPTKLIKQVKSQLSGFKIGDRSVYRALFVPTIKPDFMFTKVMASYPIDGEELDSYDVGKSKVRIFSLPNSVHYLYHVTPPEFDLSEEEYELLDSARKIMAEHKPKRSEFVDPQRMREVFFNIGRDLIEELVDSKRMKLKEDDIKELTNILVRYTVGFGLMEILLQDDRIQDVSANAPMGELPLFVVHADLEIVKPISSQQEQNQNLGQQN